MHYFNLLQNEYHIRYDNMYITMLTIMIIMVVYIALIINVQWRGVFSSSYGIHMEVCSVYSTKIVWQI